MDGIMKTLRLNRADSAAYTNGERRFWRAMKPQPDVTCTDRPYWFIGGFRTHPDASNPLPCPWGKPGDRIILAERNTCGQQATITSITVEQRGGRWGWVVEVGA